MPTARHRLTRGGEQLEVVALARAQRIAVEMRDYSLDELEGSTSDFTLLGEEIVKHPSPSTYPEMYDGRFT